MPTKIMLISNEINEKINARVFVLSIVRKFLSLFLGQLINDKNIKFKTIFTIFILIVYGFIMISISFTKKYTNMFTRVRTLLLLLTLQMLTIHCQYPINMSANYKYAYSGIYIIDINSQIQASNATDWNNSPAQFTIPYPKSLANTDVLVDPFISDLSFTNILGGIDARVYLQNVNGTFMTFFLYTNNANNIQKISMAYLILYNNITFVGNFAAYKYNFTVNKNISQGDPFLGSIVLPAIINNTGGVNSFGVIAGLSVSPTNLVGIIGVISNFAVLSQSQLGFSISSLTNFTTYIKQMAYVILLYNQGYFNESICNTFNGVVQQVSSNSLSYSNQAFQMQSFNTLLGLTSFQIYNQSSLQLAFTLKSPNSFWANSSNVYSYISVSYLVFFWRYCDYRSPYLNSKDSLCYVSCPAQTEASQSSLQCVPCSNCGISASQEGLPVYAIILVSVFGGFIFVIVILAVIYFKYLKKRRQDKYKPDGMHKNNIRKVIKFPRPDLQKTLDPFKPNQVGSKIKPYSLPEFHPIEGAAQVQRPPSTAELKMEQQKWQKADSNIQFQQLCSCTKQRPFLRCGCKHNFHLTCLLDQLQKDKQERRCPLCRQQIPAMAEFYCNKCRQYYKMIDLDFYNQDRTRLSKLNINCRQCPI